jgi:hypothetical protein
MVRSERMPELVREIEQRTEHRLDAAASARRATGSRTVPTSFMIRREQARGSVPAMNFVSAARLPAR